MNLDYHLSIVRLHCQFQQNLKSILHHSQFICAGDCLKVLLLIEYSCLRQKRVYFDRSFYLFSFCKCILKYLNYEQYIFDSYRNIQIMIARGPNSLNLASYSQGLGEQHHFIPPERSQIDEEQGKSLEEMFDNYIKDIQRYDEILGKVTKSLDEISAEEYFITDFYPEFILNCTYQSDHEKRIIADTDLQLSKVIQNIEINNRRLKEEVKGWLFQYAKKTRLSEVLLTENKLLRKYVSQKNKDIVKLIQSITNTQNQQLNQLQENVNELREQNGVLLQHLKQVKKTLGQKQDEEKKIVEAYRKVQHNKLELETKVQKNNDEQEHYSKMIKLLQNSIADVQTREKKLLEEKSRLTKILNQYEKDNEAIQKEIDSCKIDRNEIDKHLKQKFKGHQNQKQKLMDQIQDLTQKIQRIKVETKNHEEEISRLQNKSQQLTKVSKDLTKKAQEIEGQIQLIKQNHQKIKKEQIQLLSSIDLIEYDISSLKEEMKELQEKEEKMKDKYKQELRNEENNKKKQVEKWADELSKAQWRVNKEILQEKTNIEIKKKEIEQWQSKIGEKKSEISELKQQMLEIKQNQNLLANLKNKMREEEGKNKIFMSY